MCKQYISASGILPGGKLLDLPSIFQEKKEDPRPFLCVRLEGDGFPSLHMKLPKCLPGQKVDRKRDPSVTLFGSGKYCIIGVNSKAAMDNAEDMLRKWLLVDKGNRNGNN